MAIQPRIEWGSGVEKLLPGGVMSTKGTVSIIVERCKACGFCVEFCPTKVLALSSAFNSKGYHPPHVIAPEKCSGCDLCGMYCPDFAIYGHRINTGPNTEKKP
jgi:2-oxoglutarate ferredoxin oxidoreductase subunit delta